ncbi:MAG TPA: hypothetical protein VLA60_01750 [Nitrospirales bacterium]|nr:hypothetical protein [Nitrospirales bacterium]
MKIWLMGFCVFLITGGVGAEAASPAKRCTGWEEGKGHCKSKGASWDKHGSEARTLCEAGNIIQVSDIVESAALDLLRRDYLLLPIGENPSELFPTHVVIAPQDLDDPGTIALLREAHQVGKTVAIVGANQVEARTFHRLLRPGQEVNCAPQPGQTQIPLYGLQQSVTRVPGQNSTYCLGNLDRHRGNRKAERRWLKDRFAATPPQPREGDVSGTSDPTTFLTDLATATHCSFKFPNNGAGTAEVDYYVYGMRNFSDTGCSSCSSVGADYYLVQEDSTFEPTSGNWFSTVSANLSDASGELIDTNISGLLFTDPQTVTTVETSYTNDSGTTVSGSVGLNSDGPNVTAGGSVTSGQSTTYSMPATTINNASDPKSLNVDWNFTPQTPIPNTEYDYSPTWTWFVPQDAYPNGGTGNGQVTFTSYPNVGQLLSDGIFIDQTIWEGQCNIPYPFSAWTVSPPQLTSFNPPTTQKDGGQFTITGEFLYPGSVTAVLIGGQSINLGTNVDFMDDTTIQVVVGNLTLAAGTYSVQVNTQFNGQNRFSNTLELELTN